MKVSEELLSSVRAELAGHPMTVATLLRAVDIRPDDVEEILQSLAGAGDEILMGQQVKRHENGGMYVLADKGSVSLYQKQGFEVLGRA